MDEGMLVEIDDVLLIEMDYSEDQNQGAVK